MIFPLRWQVFVQLFKPSDESVSEPQDFYFLPAGEERAVEQRPGSGSRGGQVGPAGRSV